MNLEAMFFPTANINHQFDEMVMGCAELINTYTVESNFDELRVKRSLVKNKGIIRADLHSAGGMFQFEFYNGAFPQEFKIEFKADNNTFKIVYEIDQSNPEGHLTLFAQNSTSLLVKEVKEMLKRITDNASIKKADESNIKAQNEVEKPAENEVQVKIETAADQLMGDPAITVKEKLHCKCPVSQEQIDEKQQSQIEHFSDKVTRHFHVGGSEHVTIYECRHCGTYIMIQSSTQRSGKLDSLAFFLNNKTANYLISIQDQLTPLIQERGVGVINEIISGTSL